MRWLRRVFGHHPDNGDRLMYFPADLINRIRAAAEADGTGPMHWTHRTVEAALDKQREGQQ